MNDYIKQADKFLADTGTEFTIVFQFTGPYFAGETDQRDVFRFTLKNEKGSYTSNFGDSIHNTKNRVKINPSAYDILAGLTKNDLGTFADFCADYGYNDLPLSDYPKIMAIYNACCDEYKSLRRMFNDEQLDQLGEIS